MDTAARRFITLLQAEIRTGAVTRETEQHLKHDFRKLSRQGDGALSDSISIHIDRLEREAAMLRKLRALCFGVA